MANRNIRPGQAAFGRFVQWLEIKPADGQQAAFPIDHDIANVGRGLADQSDGPQELFSTTSRTHSAPARVLPKAPAREDEPNTTIWWDEEL